MRPPAVLALLLLLVGLTGCATGHTLKAFTVPPEQAAYVTVMRPSRIGPCCTIPLRIDEHVVVKLGAREYATVEIPAGEHIASISRGMEAGGGGGMFMSGYNYVKFTAAPGEHVYILMDHSFWEVDPRVYPPALGRALVNDLKKVE
jgi:hypothetical protein